MVYPEDVEKKLGFDQVRDLLKQYCLSSSGRAKVDEMEFQRDPACVRMLLQQNLEFKNILSQGQNFPSRYYFDAQEWMDKISLEESYLEEPELLDLSKAFQTIIGCKEFLTTKREYYPTLFLLAEPVLVTGQFISWITDKIDDTAKIKDLASKELAQIRKRLRNEEQNLRRIGDQVFRHAIGAKWTPEGALPTIREGRMVIPILAEHKRRLKGFILDESATGQTVFIEPAEMLDCNNEIRDLLHAEKREVIRILKDITSLLRKQIGIIKEGFSFLSTMDWIRAKGKVSILLEAEHPILHDHEMLTLYQGRHPLLFLNHSRNIVPLQVELHAGMRVLLVSGPNAGGKSVCLKTVGLLQYMLQSGMLVPVSERCQMGMFNQLFLDIGDQQSIENDLSTYSSHLKNMRLFLEKADDRSLVLMDELGAGTDPNFGGAIAEAVLKGLMKKSVWGIITTHYYNLKLFAESTTGIQNAAMRFDEKKMVPLFQLEIGRPGSSFALEVAQKIGLPEEVLSEAHVLVGKELAGFETLAREMEQERQELSERIEQIEEKERNLDTQLKKYRGLLKDLESKKSMILTQAKTEAQELLKSTNKEIEKTIRHIKENKAQKTETKRARDRLENLSGSLKPSLQKTPKEQVLKIGDAVRISGQEGVGVIQMLQGNRAVVQFGELKSIIQVSKLEKSSAKTTQAIGHSFIKKQVDIHQKRIHFKTTLDLRGKRVEEVGADLDQFLDTALLLGQGEIKILHGKGNGVLRKVVREQLQQYPQVESFGDENIEQGGDGITVVILK